ncbi:MAG TPA: transposase [Acidimicrobiales bacterium]|nr:transposase [Acidimicrobiales bacterium]
MPSGSNLPTSLLTLLAAFRRLFTGPSFVTFCSLVCGFLTQTGEHNVCGMLSGAGLATRWHHGRAHRFFSHRRWSIDRVGLVLAQLVVQRLVAPGAPLELAVDDTLFRRSGRKVFGARWCHDGAAVGPTPVGFGNCFVVLGLVVRLPFCSRPVCLPVLCALWQQGSKVAIARRLVEMLAVRFPDRTVHVTCDGAYVSRDLRGLPSRITWTTRVRKNAALHDLTPPRTGRPGRPRTKGLPLPPLLELAATLPWTRRTLVRYGISATVELAHRQLLWYLPFGAQPVRLVLARDPGANEYEIALITTDLTAAPSQVVECYASRWSIEVAFEEAKQVIGVGEARNRTENAVRRTTPFGLVCQSLLTLWYATSLHVDEVVQDRRRRAPWYRTKAAPSTADMLAMARRVLIAAQYSPIRLANPTASEILEVQRAWAMAAA